MAPIIWGSESPEQDGTPWFDQRILEAERHYKASFRRDGDEDNQTREIANTPLHLREHEDSRRICRQLLNYYNIPDNHRLMALFFLSTRWDERDQVVRHVPTAQLDQAYDLCNRLGLRQDFVAFHQGHPSSFHYKVSRIGTVVNDLSREIASRGLALGALRLMNGDS